MKYKNLIRGMLLVALYVTAAPDINAQAWNNRSPVNSPEVGEDGSITFRIYAPNADTVRLSSSDLPGQMFGAIMDRDDEGEWSVKVGPFEPGSYRYNFNVDGLSVIDPVNPITSQSNANTWSLATVSGDPEMDTRDVPRGAVSVITYYSESLGKFRRMHVYTPPGYEAESDTEYPVFYLLHGAGDNDNSWSTVGRAGFIADNLLADGKAEPMIIVMPDGHTSIFRWGAGGLNMNEFVTDFNADIKPYIEEHFRVKTDRANTAIAGLSMGGAHTLDIAIPNLGEYAYIGVYSSGVFGINGGAMAGQGPTYQERNAEMLNDDSLKEGLELLWFATGDEDFLLETTRGSVKMFEEFGFEVTYEETGGGHTWLNWRDYLIEFIPMLFNN